MKELAKLYLKRSPHNLEQFKKQLDAEKNLTPSQKDATLFLYQCTEFSLSSEDFVEIIQLEQAKILVESVLLLIHHKLIQFEPNNRKLTLRLTSYFFKNGLDADSQLVESDDALKIIRIGSIIKTKASTCNVNQLELIQKIEDGSHRRDVYLICYSLAKARLLDAISFEQVLKFNVENLYGLEKLLSILITHEALTDEKWSILTKILLQETYLTGFNRYLECLEKFGVLSKETIDSCFKIWTTFYTDIPSVNAFETIIKNLHQDGLLSPANLSLLSKEYDADWRDFLCHLIRRDKILTQENLDYGVIHRKVFVNIGIQKELAVLPICAPQLYTKALNFIKEQAQRNSPLPSIVSDLKQFIATSTLDTIKQAMRDKELFSPTNLQLLENAYNAPCRIVLLYLIQYDFLTQENFEQGVTYRSAFIEQAIQWALKFLPFDNLEVHNETFNFIMEQARNKTPLPVQLANFEDYINKNIRCLYTDCNNIKLTFHDPITSERIIAARLAVPQENSNATTDGVILFKKRCEEQIERLASYKNPIAVEKHRILTEALRKLTRSDLLETNRLSGFKKHIETHKQELLKPHSSIPKDILKGLSVFIGFICGVYPGIYLAKRFFNSNRLTTTEEQIVNPALQLK